MTLTAPARWPPHYAQAWNDLVGLLRQAGYTLTNPASVYRAYLRSLMAGDGSQRALLTPLLAGNDEALFNAFRDRFLHFAHDRTRQRPLWMHAADGATPAGIPSITRPRTFTGSQQDWDSLVARLRGVGHLTGNDLTAGDVYRAFLISRGLLVPEDERPGSELLSEFNTAYANTANRTPKYREDGTEITLAPAPTQPPGNLSARFDPMNQALSGLTTPQHLAHFNRLLNPHAGQPPVLRAGQVRLSGDAAKAAQGFAVAALGGINQTVTRIQQLLAAGATIPEGMAPYVQALRAQLGSLTGDPALQRIRQWLADSHAGVTTDLAIMLARSTHTAQGENPVPFQGWSMALAQPRPGRTGTVAATQLLTTGANGVITLSPHAVTRAGQSSPQAAPAG